MKKYIILIALVLMALLVCPASAWLSGYNYQKDIVLNSTYSTTLTSYQIKTILWNTSGTDSGTNIYLNGHVSNTTSWDDIRFTTTTDALCDYWIQETNSSAAIIWVEAPYIYTGSTTLRLYYNNPTATAVSDGDATFRFFGTFAVNPLNVDKWVGVGNYSLYTDSSGNTIADIKQNATSGTSSITSLDTFSYSTGYEQLIRANMSLYPANLIGIYRDANYYVYFGASREVNNSFIVETRDSAGVGGSTITNIGSNYTGWRIFKIRRDNAGTYCSFTIDHTVVANHTTHIPISAMPLSFQSTAVNGQVMVDWAFVKRFATPEPHISYTNPEHVQSSPNADFEGTPAFGANDTTVYFIDLTTGVVSTWNWSFGDGTYSTLQSPNHTYSTPGLYDVSLTATNSNGTDTQLKTDYIYIWSTETPTPTPTGNTSVLSQVVIEPADGTSYFPVELYYLLILVALAFFVLSVMTRTSADIMGVLAAIFFLVLAWLSMAIGFNGVGAVQDTANSTIIIQPYLYTPFVPYLTYIWLMLFFVSLINLYRIWHNEMMENVAAKEREDDIYRENRRRKFGR